MIYSKNGSPITEDEVLLGSGKAGIVFRARLAAEFQDLPAGSTVAVKKYRAWILEDEAHRERLAREASIVQHVVHPNVLRTYGLVETDSGPVLLMEFVEGGTLREALDCRSSHNWESDATQILAGVAALHSARLVHRDIKPENILVSKDGRIRIADFGVLKTSLESTVTKSAEFLGTIRYAAPEYLFDGVDSIQSDQYSVGAILYELLFTKPWIDRLGTFASQIVAIRDRESHSATLPLDRVSITTLDTLIRLTVLSTLLEKDPGQRFADSMDAFLAFSDGYKSGWWEACLAGAITQAASDRARFLEYQARLRWGAAARKVLTELGAAEAVISRAKAFKKEWNDTGIGDGGTHNYYTCPACAAEDTCRVDMMQNSSCGLCGFEWEGGVPPALRERSGFAIAHEICQTFLSRWSPPTGFRNRSANEAKELLLKVYEGNSKWWLHQGDD